MNRSRAARSMNRSWAARYRWPALPLVLSLLAPVTPVSRGFGQQETASLWGMVISHATGEPLLNARISLSETDRSALTDEEGRFRLDGVPPGKHMMEVSFLGAVSEQIEIELQPGQERPVRIRLDIRLTPLPPIEVTVNRRPALGKLAGFYRRMEQKRGHFVTREDIERWNPFTTSDLLRRVPGMRLLETGFGEAVVTVGRQRDCLVDYWVDGIRALFFNVDDLLPRDIEGIEVYRGISEVPVQFRRPATCAAIVIWTRDPGASLRERPVEPPPEGPTPGTDPGAPGAYLWLPGP